MCGFNNMVDDLKNKFEESLIENNFPFSPIEWVENLNCQLI